MKQFYLANIVTKDKLKHQGIYVRGVKRAILYQHGLSSTFYGDLPMQETYADVCEKEGWGFAAFHNRGHDLLTSARKMDGTPPYGYSYYPAGAGREVFTETVLDIEAGIDFLAGEGYSEIILVGHSTGANKVCYYAATQTHPNLIGVILSGPVSDRLSAIHDFEKFKKDLVYMHGLIDAGNGDELLIGYHFFPLTPKRFVSLFEPRSVEDVFDYGEPEPHLVTFSKIQLPLFVILSGKDEAMDRPAEEIKKAFDTHTKSSKYASQIIPGALHRYNGHEEEAVAAIISWAKTI